MEDSLRLTRALRGVMEPEFMSSVLEAQANSSKPSLKLERGSTKGLSWSEICKKIPKEDASLLHNLHKRVATVCEGQDADVIDDLVVFIFRLFSGKRNVSQKDLVALRQIMGAVKLQMATEILKEVQTIEEKLGEDTLNFFLDRPTISENGNANGRNEKETFLTWVEKNICYELPKVVWPDTAGLPPIKKKRLPQIVNNFTMVYEKKPSKPEKNEFNKAEFVRGLRKCYQKYASEMCYEEFCQMLSKKISQSGDNVQNELFDLFGYECLQFIEDIIRHKNSIMALFASLRSNKPSNAEQPQISRQVIVQSEKEKQLMKQVRKEEKKLIKASSKMDNKNENGDDDSSFEPIELRLKRQEALIASRAPLFPKRTLAFGSSVRENYPFVFDSNASNKNSSGFVSGEKVMLPENVRRKDSALCEEVHIPVPESVPLNVGNSPILISNLDEVGQMAFSGIKSLNRIQSIVFDAAYHTNENLLICAPTGAGKTNVALLTVVHQLKQHIENGVLLKDTFKIIYIAPMKALAAEMTASFSKRLSCLGVSVRELTGDMQLTKAEIQQTQMIVTTPEKWDVVTRKGSGDVALTSIVKLLIIDEVHLLHGDRGPVVEALVARTLRQVESSQRMIRIVGLSATLPNYVDVARFLRVNPYKGLFYFDHRFRPVPLSQTFIGAKAIKPLQQMSDMDQICYNQVVEMVRKDHQVMVFVHARNATIRTANVLREMAIQNGTIKLFAPQESSKLALRSLEKSRNKQLAELFTSGFSVHHAGMLRTDRNLVEKYFSEGLIKVLVCTSTLAWGVNLPAHAVIIKGTEIYDSKHGSFIDLGILDVLQIFGRAGRPQFDTSGHAVIITSHNKLSHYLSLLTNQFPIESSFITYLADNLNAEIALGTISNIEEAVEWLSYTYLFVRMRLNHLAYGILYQTILEDPNLERKRRELIDTAAKALDKARMIRYNIRTGDLSSTDLGRTASHFYLKYDTVEIFNELSKPIMTEADIISMISRSQEFEQLKVRDDELDELDELQRECCELAAKGGSENIHGKVNILIQTYLSRGRVNAFSLCSDLAYISQNAIRISRALFEMMLRKNNAIMAGRLLSLTKMLERQQWDHMTPLRQFYCLSSEIINKIEDRNLDIERLKEMDVKEVAHFLRHQKSAALLKKCCEEFPALEINSNIQPITRTVLRIRLKISPRFHWNEKIHGKSSEAFWIWIEDPDTNFIYHYEYFILTKKAVFNKLEQDLVMTIPLTEPLPTQYLVRATSDRWLGAETVIPLTFRGLILPETHPPHTDLLKLQPLPVTALKDEGFERLYNFTHFNPIQTQIFHCLYYTDHNVLLGAPTGSGKTIAAEIAMFRVFKQYPGQKVVYIAPLKALVRERIKDWKIRLEEQLGKKVVELTGDVSPDIKAIAAANVIVTTPEKWDGISRSWQTRSYVQKVALIVIDEIHLLGEDRGPVLEVIISRTNFITSHTHRNLRIVGLSTALANAADLACWLGIKKMGLYNFRPSVRPVQLEVHISGFPGKHYCPRMATMNRPTFQAIRQHAPTSPSLVFVSSRRQTRLTALDLIAFLAAEDHPKQWLHMPEDEMEIILENIKDNNLKLTLAFGIGLHHAGLQDKDRRIVEELFVNNKIQVLITTATLAWGVNFPAHLVVIKGTEYYDGKVKRYVDMPITDVLQMMGRAGRPQFDTSGVAVVLVHDIKKNFYKKFLYEPFPVESSLLEVLPDHINAEIVALTIKSKQEFLDYLTWTYFFRRLLKNPRYYNLEALEPENINYFLSHLVESTVKVLADSGCVEYNDEEQCLQPLPMGRIASFYYLSHQTMSMFQQNLKEDLTVEEALRVMTKAHEYDELPVRHNEEIHNEELAELCRYKVDRFTYDSPNTKAFLLLQAHFSRLPMPCVDYDTDLKSVLDQSIRILQAMIDTVAEQGWLVSTLRIVQLLQMIIQARWFDEPAVTILPHLERHHLHLFKILPKPLPLLCTNVAKNYSLLFNELIKEFTEDQVHQIHQVIKELPVIQVKLVLQGVWGNEESEVTIPQPSSADRCIDIRRDQEYTLIIDMKRRNHSPNLRAHSPMFHRGKDEGWVLVLGDIKQRELLALKRVAGVNVQGRISHLVFTTPSNLGHYRLTFYLLSDCYMGLDQQYDLHLNVIP